jgi:hypothetical protein
MWDCGLWLALLTKISFYYVIEITRYPYRFLRLTTTIIYLCVRRVVVVGLGQL